MKGKGTRLNILQQHVHDLSDEHLLSCPCVSVYISFLIKILSISHTVYHSHECFPSVDRVMIQFNYNGCTFTQQLLQTNTLFINVVHSSLPHIPQSLTSTTICSVYVVYISTRYFFLLIDRHKIDWSDRCVLPH